MDFRAPTMDDADAIVAMLIECDKVDFGAPDYDLLALHEEWDRIDVERDAFYAPPDVYGLLLGRDVRAWVHPARRHEDLLGPLLDRIEARARALGHPFVERQVPHNDPGEHALLEARGYVFQDSLKDLRLDDDAVAGLPAGAVRRYDPGRDEAASQALIERSLAHGAGRIQALDTLKRQQADDSLWFVADAPDGSLAGVIRSELRPTGFITGYLREVAVAPEHRGHGIGGALIGAAARELVGRGAVLIRLHVRSGNTGALRLYERLGFSGEWGMDELRLTFS